jgi:hypothetical protein
MNGILILPLFLVLVAFSVFRLLSRRNIGKASKTSDARLERIQIASLWIQLLMGFSFIMWVYSILAFVFGWPFFSEHKVKIFISHSHVFTSPAEMPQAILAWWSVKMAWMLFFFGVMFSLFRLYQKGILFSAKNIRHINSLAYFLIGNWAIDYQLQSTLRDMDLSTTPLFVGFLIIFIAWIMDEGRKIQEEQELTV